MAVYLPKKMPKVIIAFRTTECASVCKVHEGWVSAVKSTKTLLFLDDVQLLGLQGVWVAGGVGIQGVRSPNTLLFLDDVQLLGLQGVQGAGGVGIQGVK